MNNESTDSKSTETSSDSGAPTLHRRENSPDHSIRADGPVAQGGDATIHDRTGLYIAILALALAGAALGYEMAQRDNRIEAREAQSQATEARIAAAVANARADMQQQIASAEATAREARTEALVTKDKLEELRDALNAKGMKLPKLDGHN
jgi:hypothetical protein